MRRRIFPNMIGDVLQLEERQERLERVMQVLGITPEYPYTVNVNDGTRNRVMLGKINGDYGIKIIDNAGNNIILANGTIVANAIKTGTLDCSLITVTNLNAGSITTGYLSATRIQGGTLNCGLITVSNLNAGSITVGTFSSPNDRFSNESLSGVKISQNTLHANRIVAYSITADKIASHSITANELNVSQLSAISSNIGTITAGTINAGTVNVNNLNASNLNRGIINVGYSGQPSQIYIRRYGSNGYLNWEGGSKIWVDNSEFMGYLSRGSRHYFYSSGSLIMMLLQFPTGYLNMGLDIYGGLYVQNDFRVGGTSRLGGDIDFQGEHHVRNIDALVGYNDIRYVLGNNSYYHSFANADWNENAWITSSGGLEINGNFIAHGSKSFRIKHPEDENKYIQYSAIESSEVSLKIRGCARLAHGKVTIVLPHHWELVTEKDGLITIQLTALDDCIGLYAPKNKLKNTSFEVQEFGGGKSNAEFCWELTAIRKGFSDYKVEPTNDDLIKENVEKVIEMEKSQEQTKVKAINELREKGISKVDAERIVNERKPIKRSVQEMVKFKEIYENITNKEWIEKPNHDLMITLKDGLIITDGVELEEVI